MLGGLNLQVSLCLGNRVEGGRKGVFKEERGKKSSFHSYQKRARITGRDSFLLNSLLGFVEFPFFFLEP